VTPQETDALVRRANAAGFSSIAEYALSLEQALRSIANENSGSWGWVAHRALTGRSEKAS
jgi:hypothetical protein